MIVTHSYTHDQVMSSSLTYFNGDELAASVFAGKYALKDENGAYLELTPFDMHARLASEFARVEAKYANPMSLHDVMALLSSFDPTTGRPCMGDVVPQGSPMSAIGNPHQLQSLSNCFVIPPCLDSYGSILQTDQRQIQIMKRRGGVGHDISNIRPRGMRTSNAAGTTDGIGVFMERFSNSTREVAQGGRRGALMLTIDVRHPDVETFIDIKRDVTKVTGANVSVKVTDDFMRAVKSDEKFTLQWPVDVPASEVRVTKVVKAKELWNRIVSAAHERAEPGVLFWDTALRMTPSDVYADDGFRSSSTNPCGEIVLNPYGACRLMLINVSRFVVDAFTLSARFDHVRFDAVVQRAQRLMDDLVDLEIEAIDRIIAKVESDDQPYDVKQVELEMWRLMRADGERGRRTGLGITALGDAIAMLGVTYGSPRSVEIVEDVYRTLAVGAYRSSVQLAKERGAFPVFSHEREVGHPFLERVLSQDDTLRHEHSIHGRRNIALLTTAPAGSVSLLTQTTSGCEPVFKRSYTRRKKLNPNDAAATVDFVDALGDRWQHFKVYHHGLMRWMKLTGETDEERSPYAGAASDEIDWNARVDIQAAAQRWICHSISSTVNLPREATVETVSDLYMRAWEGGCKGVTVYRDGSRDGVLVSEPSAKKDCDDTIVETDAPKRPKALACDIHRANVKGQSYLIVVGLLNERPYEVFCGLSERVEMPKRVKRGRLIKNGRNSDGVATYNLEIPLGDDDQMVLKDIVEQFDNTAHSDLTRTMSLALRHGVPVRYLVEQLRKSRNPDMTSFSSVLARVLSKHYIADGTKATQEKKCGSCGSTNLQYQNGCITCADCGNSRCG